MAERQKLIAVCLSQVHSFLNAGFLSELNRAAASDGYSLMVFNSSLDFYWYQKQNKVPRAGYYAIQYDLFDAVFIIAHSFHDEELTRNIIAGAQQHGVPVIVAGAEYPGCYAILNEYRDCLKAVLRHVIRDHGARDTFFIAGLNNEPNSEARLRCYREVLEENGLPFGPEQVAYGNYWSRPASDIVLKMIQSGEKLPRAIFCANDLMAIAVCDTLRENGFRVPEDVIVTGFDGIPAAFMMRPHLTTCSDNPGKLADQVISLIRRLKAGEELPHTIIHSFRPVFAGSCGCTDTFDDRYDALTVYRRSTALNDHENSLFHNVERMLVQRDSDSFLKMIASSILPSSVIYLNKRLLDIYSGNEYSSDYLEENLLAIPYRDKDGDLVIHPCRLSELFPPENQRPGITVFNTIHTGSTVCGFYAASTSDLENDVQLIKRLSDVLNLVFTIHLGNARQQMLIHHLDNTLYQDSVTGLSNLRGLTRWFETYTNQEASHSFPLALSIYSIHRYHYIYENYGMNETEDVVRLVATRLVSANPDALIIARVNEDQFAVIDSGTDSEILGKTINRSTEDFYRQIESHNSVSSRPYFVEVNCGCTTVEPGWKVASPENLIRLALGEMYLNRMRNSTRPVIKPAASASEFYSAFCLLMEKNLFKFHFQPIVGAHSAQIYAYEALMRTDSLINLTPLEVLATAREYNRLYEVERATLFGIADRFVRAYTDFCGCKVFINTIPGHFLNAPDSAQFREEFESYLDCFVFELTEQDSVSEEELSRLRNLAKPGSTAQIAIDDYGAGHSNIVNVLRYAPHIIKIDRALISGIQDDSNKQLFVRNTIDFAHQNHIRALAEGVETSEELRTVIDLGIDLIQGYYTGRPTEEPIGSISESVRQEILSLNLLRASYNRDARVYSPSDGETVNLLDLALRDYTHVQITGGHVTLVGQKKQTINMVIRVSPDTSAAITLRDANLKGVNECVLRIGERSSLTLRVEGSNVMNKDGIHVPPTASLVLQGPGSLEILNNRNYSIGIGANYNDPYGTIRVELDGSLVIHSSGDKVVCLGGGRSAGDGIALLRGNIDITSNGISTVGIGSTTGDAQIEIGDGVTINARIEGNDGVAVGTVSGRVYVRSSGRITLATGCERSAALGTMSGSGEVLLEGGSVHVNIRCDVGACIGTFSGEVSVRIRDTAVNLHGEGNRVAGFGSTDGACDTRIESGDIHGEIYAGERMLLGNEHSRVVITGGNVRLFPENGRTPLSPSGTPLNYLTPQADHFEQVFSDRHSTWTYVADRNKEGVLGVWIPQGTEAH